MQPNSKSRNGVFPSARRSTGVLRRIRAACTPAAAIARLYFVCLTFRGICKHTAFIIPTTRRVSPAPQGQLLADSTTSRVSFTLDSNLESVDKIEQTAEQYAERAGFDEDTAAHIAMAVREAAVNAVMHGNAYDPEKQVSVLFETTAQTLTVRVADQGPGLDPDTIPDPLAPENILRGSGRGIFLIRAFMDEVHFRQLHPGTELTLIKHRTPSQGGT